MTTIPLSPQDLLTERLNADLAGSNSCLVVENGSGGVVYQRQPNSALIPASTQKLLVAEAALAVLGPSYQFTTKVMAPSAPVKGQVGNLWLVGGGDPVLAAPDFVASLAGQVKYAGYSWTSLSGLAGAVAAAGITSVPGGIHGDASAQNGPNWLPTWPNEYLQSNTIGLLSALSINEGLDYAGSQSTEAGDPAAYSAATLGALLAQHGVSAAGGADGTAPANAVVVATVVSAPLSNIVEALLRESDNWIAELLTRALDKAKGGSGTTAGGVAIVLQQATAAGIPLAGAVMDDGSGLSRTDRATCTEMMTVLNAAPQTVLDGLAIAGETGSLATRLNGTSLQGRLHAKSGTLEEVAGLVGYETVRTPLRFAYLDNDNLSQTALENREDAIAESMAAYSA